MIYDRVKRGMDVLVALIGLLVASPFMALISLGSWMTQGSPIIFHHERAGLNGKPFTLLKFRTMRLGAYRDDERITRWGWFLRKTSMDELPQLWNILRGDMSLIGPRPLPTSYSVRYSERDRVRLTVRPGLTGLAQVRGRNRMTWKRQFALDRDYVRNRGFLLDLRILILTPLALLRTRDAAKFRAEYNPKTRHYEP